MRNLSMALVKNLNLFITPELVTSFRSERFDLIHLHGHPTFQNLIAFYAKKYSIPFLFQAHGSLPRMMGKGWLKAIYDYSVGYRIMKSASRCIALTTSEAMQYMQIGVPKEKIAIIPNVVDLSTYGELPPKNFFKRKLGLSNDARIVLFIGRLHRIKGVDILIKAYAQLINRTGLTNIRLVIAGPDDGYRAEIEGLINYLGLDRFILLTGPLYGREKLEAYVDSEFVVLPSRYEAFPMVVLESNACSRPVIASDVESMQDLVQDGITGLIFKDGSVSELCTQMTYLLSNPEQCSIMGERSRSMVGSKFSLNSVLNEIEELYRAVIVEHG